MTPFDEMTVIADPGAPISAPNDPGDTAQWNRIVAKYEGTIDGLKERIERMSREIHALQGLLHQYRGRERAVLDVLEREQRHAAYARLHAFHPEPGLHSAAVVGRTPEQLLEEHARRCDCTMSRGDLIDFVTRRMPG